MHEGLQRIAAAWDTPERAAVLAEVWPGLTRIAIDHAISEPLAAEGGIAVVPAVLGWRDAGGWSAIAETNPPRPDCTHRALGDSAQARAPDATGARAVTAPDTP